MLILQVGQYFGIRVFPPGGGAGIDSAGRAEAGGGDGSVIEDVADSGEVGRRGRVGGTASSRGAQGVGMARTLEKMVGMTKGSSKKEVRKGSSSPPPISISSSTSQRFLAALRVRLAGGELEGVGVKGLGVAKQVAEARQQSRRTNYNSHSGLGTPTIVPAGADEGKLQDT